MFMTICVSFAVVIYFIDTHLDDPHTTTDRLCCQVTSANINLKYAHIIVYNQMNINQRATLAVINITNTFVIGFNLFSELLLRSGDIHPHPGPSSLSDASLNNSTSSYINIINSGLSIMHLNIQSIKNKIDILEIEAQPYDILIFTETWLTPNTINTDLRIPNFNLPFRYDRKDRIGGGVAIYVRDTLHAKQRNDLSLNGL